SLLVTAPAATCALSLHDALPICGFAAAPDFTVVNRAQARAAAQGSGYKGSLNLSLAEARDLGAAVGCDFLTMGDAQTLLRSASRSEEHTSELQSQSNIVCRLLLE